MSNSEKFSKATKDNLQIMGPVFGPNLVPISAILFNKLHVSVQSPPYIVKQPPTKELYFKVKTRPDENEKPFVIECEAEGEPAPK